MSRAMHNYNHKTKCSRHELKLLGDFWTLEIIQSLNEKEKRFLELARDLSQASPTTLTNRLKKLEKQKIVDRQEETLDKLSVVYSLTAKGRGIIPILREIKSFADKFLNT